MKNLLAFLALVLILVSCGGNKDNRAINEYLSAFLKDNKKVIAFGKLNVNSVLDKAGYKQIPKLGVVADNYLKELNASINIETPVYFALEGPLSEDGTPETAYAFFEVVNADSLVDKITQQGFDPEIDGDLRYIASGDVAIGVKNNLCVLISKKGEYDAKKMLKESFEKVKDDLSEGKVDDILQEEGDLVLGVSMENMYLTSNTELAELSKEKKEKVQEMVEDSYILSTLKFEKGQTIFESKNLFSSALNEKMFLKEDGSAAIVSKLGAGNPTIGLSMNMDMKKLQGFLEEYSPNTLKDLGENAGGAASFLLASGGEDALSNLFSGEIGAVMVGAPNAYEGLSDFNFFVGLGKQGKMMADQAKMFLSLGMAEVNVDSKGLSAFSNKDFAPSAGKRLAIPKGCEEFGKKGITAFVNLEGVDLSTFEFENWQKIIYLIKNITFEMDNAGSRLVITAKDGSENMLKQSVDLMVEELADKIGALTL